MILYSFHPLRRSLYRFALRVLNTRRSLSESLITTILRLKSLISLFTKLDSSAMNLLYSDSHISWAVANRRSTPRPIYCIAQPVPQLQLSLLCPVAKLMVVTSMPRQQCATWPRHQHPTALWDMPVVLRGIHEDTLVTKQSYNRAKPELGEQAPSLVLPLSRV